ncbi:Kdo hydroxylase family protein [Janthinobacterium agaricidamnosum]|uniref:3-deoxy-D-manno-oct-2-ulosonic acid (Kdo) hydroxylase family protein n=1 Tax=Janthinobacterium agaricidamnosum NBRC 102515 = DSM 9628 TaxID=1349767 RepID=W0VBI6_9BURK|nr:Kdo hydroxylase family protein [Janthinobacterium agaricidamnosum]CDG84647.1 putative uncharacterized protein wbxY [Janthinobacterium agaricidamnosum NBRC 102515 = DSM 9628]
MSDIVELSVASWDNTGAPALQASALQALESGKLLLLPQLPFVLTDHEMPLLTSIEGSAKNISWDAKRGVRGNSPGRDPALLDTMMRRYATYTRALMDALLPSYGHKIKQGNTSFRPVEISGRVTSWRKDDTRLHVDSFPSSPNRGERILRIFSNVNPNGLSRVWKLGAPFEDVAQRFLRSAGKPFPGSATLLQYLGLTKSRRSAYDHYMLQLHDKMKADLAYQAQVPHTVHAFMPGQTWMVYTDQVSHAALSGQHVLEQTWLLPPEAMAEPSHSPLAVLERLLGAKLT